MTPVEQKDRFRHKSKLGRVESSNQIISTQIIGLKSQGSNVRIIPLSGTLEQLDWSLVGKIQVVAVDRLWEHIPIVMRLLSEFNGKHEADQHCIDFRWLALRECCYCFDVTICLNGFSWSQFNIFLKLATPSSLIEGQTSGPFQQKQESFFHFGLFII
ncbi:hypothetical protein Tco_0047586 [Tanacetum coccineum]